RSRPPSPLAYRRGPDILLLRRNHRVPAGGAAALEPVREERAPQHVDGAGGLRETGVVSGRAADQVSPAVAVEIGDGEGVAPSVVVRGGVGAESRLLAEPLEG